MTRVARFIATCLLLGTCPVRGGPQAYDLVIRGATIVDGTGKPSYVGDVAIRGDRIVAAGKADDQAAREISGRGLVLAPGWIDPHSHADLALVRMPLAENLVMQGITTFVGGNCGMTAAPRKDLTFGKWLETVEKTGISINYAPLVGHNQIRQLVLGQDFKRPARPEEIGAMKQHLDEAFRSGAIGFSTFLDPSPAEYATTNELIELAETARRYDALFVPHTRGIQSQWSSNDPEEYGYGIQHAPLEDAYIGRYKGFLEAIEVSRRSRVRLHIAHISNAYLMPQPHPDFLEEAQVLATRGIIDEARKEGIDVTYDIIAWDSSIAGATRIADEFADPRQPWVARFGKDQLTGTRFVENLKNPGFRAELRKVYDAGRLKLGMIHTKVDPYWCDHFRILKCTLRECEGKTVGEVALVRDKGPLDTVFDILVADPETIWVQFVDPRMLPTAISTFLKDPNSMPSTDTSIYPAQPGPNAGPTLAYGLYPNYIRTNVNRKRLLTLEEAVRKATSYPAGRFGLKDRGVIRQGAYADLVLFDLQTIGYSGDFLNPAVRPSGIECVIVNGEVVYEKDSHTGRKPGKVLRRKDQS